LSQQDLGNLIGASREIVSLTLSEFRRREAVSMLGRRIVVYESKLRREAASVS
jgi:CRP-like cAMP-binding protein